MVVMMTQKRLTVFFFVVFFALLSVLPITNMIADKYDPFKQKPFIASEMEKKLFSTDHLEGLVNFILARAGISGDYGDVIIGKDDYYFLGANYNGLNNCRGYRFDKDGVDQTVDQLSKQKALLSQLGVKSFTMIVPDRFQIYRDMLPQWVTCSENKTTAYFIDQAKKKRLNVIYPRDALADKKISAYFRTDSHWNYRGAYIGFRQLMAAINSEYPDELLVTKEIAEFGKGAVRSGDLVKFLKYTAESPDYEYTFKPEWNFSEILKCEYDQETQTKSTCVQRDNGGTIVNEKTYSTYNEHAWNNKKMLFIGDSFGEGDSKLFQQTFKETIQVHHSRLSDAVFRNILSRERPDYVIYQIVERDVESAMEVAAGKANPLK
jgi:alginate O-acetyltransferase complex protein AlgJ